MRTVQKVIYALMLWLCPLAATGEGEDSIRLNSLGFLPDMPKRASVIVECAEFSVLSATDDEVVFRSVASGPRRQDDVDQSVWVVDFSDLQTPGQYVLDVSGVGRSIPFEIGPQVYDAAFQTAMRAFYLWRCGMAVEGVHNGERYAHDACHLDDGYRDFIGAKGERKDGTGGWHDAGDYGKYTVNAGVTVGCLFLAWDHFQDRLKEIELGAPETAPGFPEFLQEIKWEIDWLLKMPYPDGSGRVSHKLTRQRFSGMVMPEADQEKRYFTDWSSAATADFVAMMAMAARYFEPYDADYAKTCLDAARLSYACLQENFRNKRADLRAFSTGAYGTGDADDRLWAAAEMWETTGEPEFLADFESRAGAIDGRVDENWDWGNVANLGMITYALSEREGRDEAMLEQIRANLVSTANDIVDKGRRDVYARPLGGRYYWGCNGGVARQSLVVQAAHRIAPDPAYVHTTLDMVGHLFGRNYYNRSFVTGLGHNPPMRPHCRRSEADDIEAPWPGYVIGGGHSAQDWQDESGDYRTNEIAINWQAALVYVMAASVSAAPDDVSAPDDISAPIESSVSAPVAEAATRNASPAGSS